ncbi:MAG TPA: hypothetical protein VGW78_05075 [Candidatus Babeliales bacterium]|nr:hypothetical protein [Candidatus Babeliales bacterium]
MKKSIISLLLCLSVGMQAMDKTKQQKDRAPKQQTLSQRIVRPFIPRLKTAAINNKKAPKISHNNAVEAVDNQNQEIYLVEASEPIRNFTYEITKDPSIVVGVTNNPNKVAFANVINIEDSKKRLIVYQEDLAIKIVNPEEHRMISGKEFREIVQKYNLTSGQAFDVWRKTLVTDEIRPICKHEYGHHVNDHIKEEEILQQKLKNNEISREEYFAARRQHEVEADDFVNQNGSPRTLFASENALHKLCIVDCMTDTYDVTYHQHPHSCDRYARAKEAVDKMLGPWADS